MPQTLNLMVQVDPVREAGQGRGCSSKSDRVLEVVTREELYRLVWSEPMSKLAEQFGVSGSYLARVCTCLDVPRPERGYWAKLAVGKAPPQPALPEPSGRIQLTWSQTGEPVKLPKLKAPSPRLRKAKVAIPRDRVHPLIVGAAKHFESGRDVEEGSYLRPFKKMLVDITAAQPTLEAALDLANELFNALEAAGHRVALAPYNARLRRLDVEEREPVGKPRAHWEYPYPGFWSPDRPTVVFVGTVAIGLQIVEMSETVTLRYVRGKYIRDSDYVPPKRGYQDHTFTTTRAVPSGRLRIIAYSPYSGVDWSGRWQDSTNSPVRKSLSAIVAAITAEASKLVDKLAEAERQAEIRHREWLQKMERIEREEDRRKIAESVERSTADLRAVITRWGERVEIERFLAGVEARAAELPVKEQVLVLQRLTLARIFLGTRDPLDFFREWQTPEERYSPRFPHSQ
jgi:hypothetical protein